jgi:hypothetical protein
MDQGLKLLIKKQCEGKIQTRKERVRTLLVNQKNFTHQTAVLHSWIANRRQSTGEGSTLSGFENLESGNKHIAKKLGIRQYIKENSRWAKFYEKFDTSQKTPEYYSIENYGLAKGY